MLRYSFLVFLRLIQSIVTVFWIRSWRKGGVLLVEYPTSPIEMSMAILLTIFAKIVKSLLFENIFDSQVISPYSEKTPERARKCKMKDLYVDSEFTKKGRPCRTV